MNRIVFQYEEPAPDMSFNWNDFNGTELRATGEGLASYFDETLRDGIQAPHVNNPSLEQKLEIVNHMVRCGIEAADLGFPGSGPDAAKECTQIAQYIATNGYPISCGYAGRTHRDDVHAIGEIAQTAGVPVQAYIFTGVSPIRQYVEGWTVESIARNIRTAASECERVGVEFVLVLEDAVRCTAGILSQIFSVGLNVGVHRIVLCDTVGAAHPNGTAALVKWSSAYFTDRGHRVAFEWHGHNDRGLALINSMTAIAAGCDRVHGTVLGIGERTGNTSIDQLIVNSRLDGHDLYDLKALREYCEYAKIVFGIEIPHNYPAMGGDVFKTSAGVHAAAILKAYKKNENYLKDIVYSSVPASLLGRDQEILIDHSSGASNVKYWLIEHGYQLDSQIIRDVLGAAKAGRRPLSDEKIKEIVEQR